MSYYPVRALSTFEIEMRRQFEMAQQEEQPFCLIVLERPTNHLRVLNVGINATYQDVAEMVDNLMHNQHCKNSYTLLAALDTRVDFGGQWPASRVEDDKQLIGKPIISDTLSPELVRASNQRLAQYTSGAMTPRSP